MGNENGEEWREELFQKGLNMHQQRQTLQQGQLPQAQTVQDQSHDNQTNPQMQSMSMQVAGPRSQQSSFPNMRNNVLSSRPGVSAPQQNVPISIPASSLESDQGNGLNNANGGDWQEEIFQKIKSMKETYLRDLNEYYQRMAAKVQQEDSLPQQQRSDQFEKLKRSKTTLEGMIHFLSLSKSNIKPGLKDKMKFYENNIIDFFNMQRLRKTVQQGQLPKSQIQPMQQPQSQTVQDQSHDNQTNSQIQPISMQGAGPRAQLSSFPNMRNNVLSSRPGVSAPQQNVPISIPASSLESDQGNALNNANGGDWQEEIFQKIKSMKETYLRDLNEYYQRMAAKVQQEDSLPQQQRSDQFEKLKRSKTTLEGMIHFLSLSKSNIKPGLKDKMKFYENNIIDFFNMQRLRKTLQQGQLPKSQIQPMQQPQSQTVQDQSHDNQTNPQIKPMSMQGAGPRAQQSSFPNMRNNVLSSRPGVSAPQQNVPISIPASSLESDQGNALNNANGGDWQEEIFQKIKSMKETYLRDLNEYYPRVVAKLQQEDSLPQQQRSDQFEKLKRAKTMLEGMIHLLSLSKSNIEPGLKDKMNIYEKIIIDFLNMQRLGKTVQQRQLPKSQIQPMQQPQSQTVQDESHDNQKNPQIQSMSMQGAGPRAQQSKKGVVQSLAIGTPGISASPILQELTSPDGNTINPLTSTCGKSSATELPIERLIRAVTSISPQALSSAVSDIGSVVSMVDRIAGSLPGNGSRASVGEDLVSMTRCLLQERNIMTQEEMTATMKRKCHTTAMPLSVASLGGSVGDSHKQFAGLVTSDMESIVTCGGKKARTEEIKEINQRLIDTIVEISDDEDAADPNEKATSSKECEGTTIRFSFVAVSLSPALKAHLSSTKMYPIRPLRLLVPCSYPNGSPSLLDILPVETSKENEDLSSKAMARCNILLRSLSQPMSLKDIAKTWDACVRDVICEYAQQFGGGTFSSKYGTWEKYVADS